MSAGLILACGGEPPRESAAPQVKPPAATLLPAPVAAPPPEAAAAPMYVYRPEGRRDPFQPVALDQGVKKALLPPLQRQELSELQLIAVIWGSFGYHAMLQTPDGRGFTVRVGTLVGPNGGVISKINPREVVVRENYRDIFGQPKIREVSLPLRVIEEEEALQP